MMTLNQPKALEAAAQALAKHFGHDYSEIRMTDHYLRKKRRPDRQVVALVELADRLLRPHFDAITDLDDQVLGPEAGKIDDPARGVCMDKEILAQFLVRGQALALEEMAGLLMGHGPQLSGERG